MVNCKSADALVVREPDGDLTPLEREQLDRHTAVCSACRARREANLAVKPVLASRVDAGVPPVLVGTVVTRLAEREPDGWLAGIDWRLWTEWMLPVTAALALLVVLAGGGGSTATRDESGARAQVGASALSMDEWTGSLQVLDQDLTSDDLLAEMLWAPQTGGEGVGNGR
jgi:anti-sigma factor RsiW